MSLPACQQRVLDGMAKALQANEPRLAAMFTIFNRLASDEPFAQRERLPDWRAQWLSGFPSRLRSRPAGPGRISSPGAARRPRRLWLRVVAVSHIALLFVLFAVLIGLSVHSSPSCRPAFHRATTALARTVACQSGPSGLTGTVSK